MNKLLVITGGTKGIGRALIEKFASEGFDIITCARNAKDLKQLKAEIGSKYKTIQLLTFKADLSKKDDTLTFTNFVKEQKRSIEILINNTGLYLPGQIHKEKEGALEQMINTNLYSAYHISRALVGGMIKKKHGYIFNICSTASIMPYINGGSYCISKYALYGMTKVLREEVKEYNIKVTAVLPGATKTASWDGVELPDERFIKPADVADSIYSVYKLSKNTVVEEILIRPQLGDIV
ncbi:MAG TPA: SDR family oxidoreductase [Cytophagaceae bacterium]|nr:SDR family oxidoreductase [Cytophagaceae bacterium]